MHFRKYPHPANFRFAEAPGLVAREVGPGITAIEAGAESESEPVDLPGEFVAARRGFFGRCGESWMFALNRQPGDRFYGLGEKWTGFEHSDRLFKFWNTDVWADFHREEFTNLDPPPDPVYVSIPYLIVKRGDTFTGFLLDTIRPASISTTNRTDIAGQMAVDETEAEFWLAADSGDVRLLVFEGPTLPELTRRFQSWAGTTPLPPAWALGYHQCRWGYECAADLRELDARMDEHGIPCDGLWLDIDFMDGYRVFTWDEEKWPGGPEGVLADLREKGRRVLPIIDPGVKLDPGFSIYQRGREKEAFCRNPEGLDYVGLVWPGETVFPDFSLESARDWWSEEVAAFARAGIGGAWIDMNDPSTGPADNAEMLFGRGEVPHDHYHNAYALGMAEATRAGFEKAFPGERPFLLSRSGCLGSQRHTAIWTGDNVSNYAHLRACIATTLNLALSGIPFNAPDVGGFGGDAEPALLRDWFGACFLFPLLRNHSILNSRQQEPWAFDEETLEVVRRFIRLRYRLRPYLHHLFAEHERSGEAILRPLFYDFAEGDRFDHTDDAFLVGPSILQAPFLDEDSAERVVELPTGTRWYDPFAGEWRDGGQAITVQRELGTTPLFVRDRSILPLAAIEPHESRWDEDRLDFHVFLGSDEEAVHTWQRAGGEARLSATREGNQLHLRFDGDANLAPLASRLVISVEPEIEAVTLDGQALAAIEGVRSEPFAKDWRSFSSEG